MKHSIRILILALCTTLSISACSGDDDAAKKAAAAKAAQPTAPVAMPTDAKNVDAWKAYLKDVVIRNMDGVQTRSPYMYFVPSGEDADIKSARENQLGNVQTVVARGVLPGNMMAFGGPDSKATADLILSAFQGAKAGSMKNVRFLFIGTTDDSARVKAVVDPTGVDFRNVEMK